MEGRCRQEGLCCKCGLGDTEQRTFCSCGHTAVFECFFVFFFVCEQVNERTGEHIGVALVLYAYFAEHLSDDDFNVFVVDLDARRTIGGLNFFCDILLNALDALCTKHILRVDRTFCERIACADNLAFLHQDVGVVRDCVRFCLAVGTGNRDFTTVVADMDCAVVLGDDCFTFRVTCFEQFFDTRQTLCDIVVRCDTARVEGSHRELCTGFTD